MVKINGAVAHGHDRVLRILNVRLFLDHLGNAARGRKRDRQHGKDHGQHHQARENLHGIGDERGEVAGRHAKRRIVAAGDDGLGAEPGDDDHARIDARLHQRRVERDEPLALGKVLIDALGNCPELADLVLLLIKGFDDADTADIFLHDVVELIIRAEHARENREYAADNENSATARIGRMMRNVMEISRLMRNDTIMEKSA